MPTRFPASELQTTCIWLCVSVAQFEFGFCYAWFYNLNVTLGGISALFSIHITDICNKEKRNPYVQNFVRDNFTSLLQSGSFKKSTGVRKKKKQDFSHNPSSHPPWKTPNSMLTSATTCAICLLSTSTEVLENVLVLNARELKGNCFIYAHVAGQRACSFLAENLTDSVNYLCTYTQHLQTQIVSSMDSTIFSPGLEVN